MFTALREFMGREDGCINKYTSGQVTQMESVRLLQVCQFVASAEGHATGAMSCFFFTQPGRDGKILCD
ncbi:unnamed protein product, partial [Ascophyllum nodosum]